MSVWEHFVSWFRAALPWQVFIVALLAAMLLAGLVSLYIVALLWRR